MKIRVVREALAGGRVELSLEVERTSSRERHEWALEEANKLRGALLAIEAAPDRAEEIAAAIL